MGNKRNVDMSSQETKVKKVDAPEEAAQVSPTKEGEAEPEQKIVKPKKTRVRSKKYMITKSKVDKTRKYDVLSAIELVKQLSYTKFDGTIVAELEVKDTNVTAEITLPHNTGQQKKVVVVDDQVMADIEAGKLDFDILVSSPEYMPKLAKHARTLGPKGLMPNPKNGTLTANPDKAAKELSSGKQLLKTEKKQPLMRIALGKTSMDSKQLIANLKALAKVLKGKLEKVSLAATMGPGVKVDLESL